MIVEVRSQRRVDCAVGVAKSSGVGNLCSDRPVVWRAEYWAVVPARGRKEKEVAQLQREVAEMEWRVRSEWEAEQMQVINWVWRAHKRQD